MLSYFCRWYCSILLWLSGVQHSSNGYRFYGTVVEYNIVPDFIAVFAAATLPTTHLILAALLILPHNQARIPLLATAALGTIFAMSQVAALMRGIPINCGCFGGMAERQVGLVSLSIAGSLVLISVLGAILSPVAAVSPGTPEPKPENNEPDFAMRR